MTASPSRPRFAGLLALCLGFALCAAGQADATGGAVVPDDRVPYDRSLYGGWTDPEGNCLNTRAEILVEYSTGPVHMRKSGCSVDRGRWLDPYTDKIFTEAKDLDIDHIVPLAWAHARGGHSWSNERRREFATWRPNLMPVEARANRQKGSDGPDKWLPDNVQYRCEYVVRFERIARRWELTFPPAEAEAMEVLKDHYCGARQ